MNHVGLPPKVLIAAIRFYCFNLTSRKIAQELAAELSGKLAFTENLKAEENSFEHICKLHDQLTLGRRFSA